MTRINDHSEDRAFLFLQGPVTPFFSKISECLETRGYPCYRINLCFGDQLFWRRRGASNYRSTRAAWPKYLFEFMESKKITDLILLGEQRYYHKVAIALAKARAIKVYVTDFGYFRPDWITFEPDGMSGASTFPKQPERILALAEGLGDPNFKPIYADSFKCQAIWDMTYHIGSELFCFLFPGYRSHHVYKAWRVYIGTGLNLLKSRIYFKRTMESVARLQSAKTPYFVFPLQMENDFQIRSYSPYYSLKEAIETVIRSFAEHASLNSHLIIKTHPLEPKLRSWHSTIVRLAEQYGCADRVLYISSGDLQHILTCALGVVTINSTVGIWALRQCLPVVTLGEAIYDIKGLTFQGDLDTFWNNRHPPDAVLWTAFVKLLADQYQVRGVYYASPGLEEGALQAALRLLDRSCKPLDGPESLSVTQRESEFSCDETTHTGCTIP